MPRIGAVYFDAVIVHHIEGRAFQYLAVHLHAPRPQSVPRRRGARRCRPEPNAWRCARRLPARRPPPHGGVRTCDPGTACHLACHRTAARACPHDRHERQVCRQRNAPDDHRAGRHHHAPAGAVEALARTTLAFRGGRCLFSGFACRLALELSRTLAPRFLKLAAAFARCIRGPRRTVAKLALHERLALAALSCGI